MDPRYTGEILKHLEKQNEMLSETHSLFSHELHKLHVEEEMMMRKFHEFMQAQGPNEKNENGDPIRKEDDETGNSTALVKSDRQ